MSINLKNLNIVFIGFMGTGKSTISSYIAKSLNRKVIETDKYITDKINMDIPSIFDDFGEKYFRDLESEAIFEISKNKGIIISCGGGSVIRDKNVSFLKKNGIIIRLIATPDTILNRVKDSNERPILNGHMNTDFISSLMRDREIFYSKAADISIYTDNKTVEEISKECIEKATYFINKIHKK